MTGRIERFQGNSGPRVLGTSEIPAGPVQTLDSRTKQEQPAPEIHQHEEILIEGQDKIRQRHSGALDLRFRAAKDRAAWDRVKRMED